MPRWLIACGVSMLVSGAALAAEQQPTPWEKSTHVETADDAAKATAANPACAPVAANISRRVANIKALEAAILKAEKAPPTSLKSALQGLVGKSEPTANMIEYQRKITRERGAADELNTMLQSLQCAPIDVDAALAQQPGPPTAGPEVPGAVPDDLVREPRQY